MGQQDTVQFSVRVPSAHLSVLERLAEEGDRSVAAEIRRIIRRAVEATTGKGVAA